jgi:hypothetical protein
MSSVNEAISIFFSLMIAKIFILLGAGSLLFQLLFTKQSTINFNAGGRWAKSSAMFLICAIILLVGGLLITFINYKIISITVMGTLIVSLIGSVNFIREVSTGGTDTSNSFFYTTLFHTLVFACFMLSYVRALIVLDHDNLTVSKTVSKLDNVIV